jgi:hypothetical protein
VAHRGRVFGVKAEGVNAQRLLVYSPYHNLRSECWVEVSGFVPESNEPPPAGETRASEPGATGGEAADGSRGAETLVPRLDQLNGRLVLASPVPGNEHWFAIGGPAVEEWLNAPASASDEPPAPLRTRTQGQALGIEPHPITETLAEWSLVIDRGGIRRGSLLDAPEVTGPVRYVPKAVRMGVQSPRHGLRAGDRVAVFGDDWDKLNLAGTYTVEASDPAHPDVFTVVLHPHQLTGRPSSAEAAPAGGQWRLAPETGTFVVPPIRTGPRRELLSARHGLKSGDRVTIEGTDWANKLKLAATFTVTVADQQPDSFILDGFENLRDDAPKLDFRPEKPQKDAGRNVVEQAADVQDSDSKLGTQSLPPRGLKAEAGEAPTQTGTWRRVDRFSQGDTLVVARRVELIAKPAGEPDLLRVESPHHGLVRGDRIRVERIGLREGVVALGERFADTFGVLETDAASEEWFTIEPYASWAYNVHGPGPDCLSSMALIASQNAGRSKEASARPDPEQLSLLVAWRPILDRGVINGLGPGSDERRLFVSSPRHALSPGAWVFLTDLTRAASTLPTREVKDPNLAAVLGAVGTGPFRVAETREDGFEIELNRAIPGIPTVEADQMARWCIAGLLDDREVLANWSDSLLERDHVRKLRTVRAPGVPPANDRRKPKLAIVTVSGGGIRSAVWTSTVLRRLESEVTDFPYHTRMITGASGGMVGAAYYVATLRPPSDDPVPPGPGDEPYYHLDSDESPLMRRKPSDPDPMIDYMARDDLARVANQLAFSDLPSMLWPATWGADRGQALEGTWWRNTIASPTEGPLNSPLAQRMQELAVGEWQGWRPSLVFAPMFVEDGRRLLVSNLNLDFAPRNLGHVLFARGTDKVSRSTKRVVTHLASPRGEIDLYSLSAIEFFRVFPDARNFRISTAARMSAAFPLVTPAVSIPTVPPRRVVDAGYYDNYGVNLAALWLFHNREWLYEYTSGVVLIQIRDSQSERGRRELEDPDPQPASGAVARLLRASTFSSRALDIIDDVRSKASRGSQWLTSPLEGMAAARQANMSFRNDEQVEVLSNVINLWPDSPVKDQGFCTTVVFECPKEASLNWRILPRERREIENGFDPDQIDPAYSEGARRNAERLRMLMRWWNR